MIAYWCRFFDARGSAFAAERLCAENDDAASAKAKAIFATGTARSYELRDGSRVVARASRPVSDIKLSGVSYG